MGGGGGAKSFGPDIFPFSHFSDTATLISLYSVKVTLPTRRILTNINTGLFICEIFLSRNISYSSSHPINDHYEHLTCAYVLLYDVVWYRTIVQYKV